MTDKNILIIAPEYYPNIGGMEIIATELSKELDNISNFSIYVLTNKENNTPNQYNEFNFKIFNELTKEFFKDLLKIRKLIRTLKIQIIIATNSGYSFISILSSKPVYIITAANDFLRAWIGPKLPFWEYIYYHRFKNIFPLSLWYNDIGKVKFRNYFAILGLKHSTKIFANSQWTKNQLIQKKIPSTKIQCIPGGVNLENFFPKDKTISRKFANLPQNKKIIISLSHLIKVKGLDKAIPIVANITQTNPDIEYHIYGRGSQRDSLKQQIKQLKCENIIFIHDEIQHKDIPLIISSADILLQLSVPDWDKKTNSYHIESMGLVLCEANACGTPVIASNCGGIPSVITDNYNGLLVDTLKPHTVKKAINRILENNSLKTKLIENGLKRAKNEFSLEIIIKKIIRSIIDET